MNQELEDLIKTLELDQDPNFKLEAKKNNSKKKKIIKTFALFSGFLFLVLGLVFFLIYNFLPLPEALNQGISLQKQDSKLSQIIKATLPLSENNLPEEINLLILGIVGKNHPGSQLTDTIVVASIRPKDKALTLVSLPRDFLVKLPNQNNYNRINSLYYYYGIEAVKQKIEEITGIKCDRYAVVDLKTVEEVIDLVDGLNINVLQDIYDPYFPGLNYTYQTFSLKAGWRYMTGEEALKYARTRYTSPRGDFDRMIRQQQIIKAIKQKVFSLSPLWDLPTYIKIFNSISSQIKTDLTLSEIKQFWTIANNLETDKIITTTIDKEQTDLITGGVFMFGQSPASVLWPKAGRENYSEIQKYLAGLLKK